MGVKALTGCLEKVLRRISVCKRGELIVEWRKLLNEELQNLVFFTSYSLGD
jgi:hypothetical protein